MYPFDHPLPTDHTICDKLYQSNYFYWTKCADEDIINKFIVMGESLESSEALIGDSRNSAVNSSIRISQLSWIHKNESSMDLFSFITDKIDRINYWHYGMKLTGVEPLQYTRYALNGHYNFHNDMTIRQDSIQRKLSIVLALSDETDYKGGEFKLMPHGVNPNVFKFKKGDLIAFPSWIPHKVEPVTSGNRITVVAWACGPKFV